jgi:prevent-host-death family protein
MRTTTVNLHAAKTHLSRLVDQAAAGEDVIIAKAGKPMVRLVPITAAARRTGFGTLKGKIRIADDFDAPLPGRVLRAFGLKR